MKIGTQWSDGRVYAGPKYGDVSEDEYNELLQSGALGRGQQTVEMFGERLVDHAKNITPDKVKDVFGGGGHLLRDFANSKVGKVTGTIYDWTLKGTVDKTMNILGAPVDATHWASKKVDPTGRGIGKAPLAIAETVATLGTGTVKRGVKKGLTLTDDLIRANQPAYAYATVGVDSRGLLSDVAQEAVSGINKPLAITTVGGKNIIKGTSIARTKIARENIGNKEFLQQLEDKTDEITAFARKNNNSLDGYPGVRTIKLPDGRVFRLEPSGKTGSGKFSWKSMDAADAATTKRAQSIVLDEKTLSNQLGSKELVNSYKEMNSTVVKKVKSAITEYNKGLPKSQQISLEHVFDVQHYGRLGKKVKGFSGQGADELGNLTILKGAGEGGNYSTGAIARHIDSGDALIDLIRQNKFVDYTKTADDFLSFKLADTVKGFDAQDWKRFTDTVIANPETNIHELLINFN